MEPEPVDETPEEWLTSTTSDYFPSTNKSTSGRGFGRGRGRGGGTKKVKFDITIIRKTLNFFLHISSTMRYENLKISLLGKDLGEPMLLMVKATRVRDVPLLRASGCLTCCQCAVYVYKIAISTSKLLHILCDYITIANFTITSQVKADKKTPNTCILYQQNENQLCYLTVFQSFFRKKKTTGSKSSGAAGGRKNMSSAR